MLPLERAAKLRQEANIVLGLVRLYDILRLYGKVFPTGSFFLDVMAYPDIDSVSHKGQSGAIVPHRSEACSLRPCHPGGI